MKRSHLLAPAVAFCAAAYLTACSDDPSRPADLSEERSLLLSHSPAHHPAGGDVSLSSAPAYAGLDAAAAEQKGGSLHLMVDASGAIPRFPDSFIHSVFVFGYAWADLGSGKAIVAVIHPSIGRDSRQNPDGWHTHPVQLAGGTTGSGGTSDFCIVSIGRSQGGINIHDDVMRVHMAARWAGIAADALDVAASFVVQSDGGCAASGLGVVILDAESL